jgi:hypothetical protein
MTTSSKAWPDDRFLVSDGVSAREFDGDWIILDLTGGNYFGLDEVGGIMWQKLVAGLSPTEIAIDLAQTYDSSEQSIQGDVLRFVDELVARGLMKGQR